MMDQGLAIALAHSGPPALPNATEATLPSRMFLDGHIQMNAGAIAIGLPEVIGFRAFAKTHTFRGSVAAD